MAQPTIKQLLAPIFGAVKEYESDGEYIKITTENGKYSYWKTIRIDGKDVDTEEYLVKRGQQIQAEMTKNYNGCNHYDNRVWYRTSVLNYLYTHHKEDYNVDAIKFEEFIKKLNNKAADRVSNMWAFNNAELVKEAKQMYLQYARKQNKQSNSQPEPTTLHYGTHWFIFFD